VENAPVIISHILNFGVKIFMEPSPKLPGQMLPFISKVGVKTTLMCIAVLKTGWQAVSAVKRSVSCCFNKYDIVKVEFGISLTFLIAKYIYKTLGCRSMVALLLERRV